MCFLLLTVDYAKRNQQKSFLEKSSIVEFFCGIMEPGIEHKS
jgi:hypothetical protein